MSSSVKFIAAATGVIIIFVLMLGAGLGIYSNSRWTHRNGFGPTAKSPMGGTAQAWMEDAQTIKTSNGEVTISSKVNPERLGVPMYPGANSEGTGTLLYSDGGPASEEYAGARFTTTDSFHKVLDFYKNQVGAKAHVDAAEDETQSRAVLSQSSSDGQDTMGIYIVRKKESPQTEIAIHRGIARPAASTQRTN